MSNFESDCKQAIINEINTYFNKSKIKYSEKQGEIGELFEQKIQELLNICEKWIVPQKRTVHFSKNLLSQLDDNTQSLIEIFKRKFENGEDINGHLSRLIYNAEMFDLLLNYWRIKHIHLSVKEASNNEEMKSNRSEMILFCIVEENDVYFIDVRQHPSGAGFIDLNFLKIIADNNWMEHIGAMEIKGVKKVEPNIKDGEELYNLLKKGINASLEIGDKYYCFWGINAIQGKVTHSFDLCTINRKISNIAQNEGVIFKDFKLLLNKYLGYLEYEINGELKKETI